MSVQCRVVHSSAFPHGESTFSSNGPDPAQPYTRSPKTVLVELGRRSAWLTGPGVYTALVATDTPRMRCPKWKTWTCPIDRVADPVAYLEHRLQKSVEFVEVDR